MAAIIETHNLTCRFGDFTAVDRLCISIPQGAIYGFLGPNGAGKSTAIRMLCGLLQPTEGEITILGKDGRRDMAAVRPHIGYMSQLFSLYPDLTVEENLNFYASMYGLTGIYKKERIEAMLKLSNLSEQRTAKTGALSTGVRQRLALGSAILHEPQLLFLDEPTSGVDPNMRRLFWDILYDLADTGTTILVTTHFMDEAEHCDQVAFINAGKLLVTGSPPHLKAGLPGHLIELASDDAFSLLAAVTAGSLSYLDAYVYGKNLRLLLQSEVPADFPYPYTSITPSMEDVFSYYAKHTRR